MSLRQRLMPLVAKLITSERLQQWRRAFRESRRKLQRRAGAAVERRAAAKDEVIG